MKRETRGDKHARLTKIRPEMEINELEEFNDQWIVDTEDMARGHDAAGRTGLACLIRAVVGFHLGLHAEDEELGALGYRLNLASIKKLEKLTAETI